MRNLSLRVLLVAGVALLLLLAFGTNRYVDYLWFNSLGYVGVFWRFLTSRLALQTAVGLAFTIGLFIVFRIAMREGLRASANWLPPPWDTLFYGRRAGLLPLAAAALLGLLVALSVADYWLMLSSFIHRTPFAHTDPVFGRDISFYVFSLPAFTFLYQLASSFLVISLLVSLAIGIIGGAITTVEGRYLIARRFRSFLLTLLALWLLVKGVGYWLDMYQLVYSPRGVAFGASYTDVHASLVAFRILAGLAVVAALLTLVDAFTARIRLTWIGLGLLIAVSIIGGTAYPALVEQFIVSPNQLAKERPYIAYNIAGTRQGFGLEQVRVEEFVPEEGLNIEVIERNRDTIDNIRLWDWRPLLQVFAQEQALRPYYTFNDVDVDRYYIDGRVRQVLLSARELDVDLLQEEAQTWVNQHLKYTHGYGVVAVPSTEIDAEGRPHFWIKDIPPTSTIPIKLERPEIYYGESTDEYVIVKTDEPEFDYPAGENVYTTYEGTGGVPVGSLVNRLSLALYLDSYRIIFTGSIRPESRVLLHRNIHVRVKKIAPFLAYDRDPYLVMADGRLYWIIDAYTVSTRYPYSEPYAGDNVPALRGINYIRNSVKVVVDAYNGSVTYYAIDEEDPILATYRKIFPGLFRSFQEMPSVLRDHLRYPQDLFQIQAEVYTKYHMTDPEEFYNQEDLWNIPVELYSDKTVRVEPYYVVMQLPGETEPEFILMLTFTPSNKPNLVAWMAARSDGEKYGELLVYNFPSGHLTYGVMQVEAHINQDADISAKLSLWDQRGSQVIRGNLLVIPIEKYILYVEPLYLQSTQNQWPQLKRVIVAHGGRVIMEQTLEAALTRLFGQALPPAEPPAPDTGPPTTRTVESLVIRANEWFKEALDKLRQGDWAGYGEAIEKLGEVLNELEGLVGEPSSEVEE